MLYCGHSLCFRCCEKEIKNQIITCKVCKKENSYKNIGLLKPNVILKSQIEK